MLKKSWFIVLVIGLLAVFVSACAADLTGAAGTKATFEECKQEIGSDAMSKKCIEFFADAFQEGDEAVIFDYAACTTEILDSNSSYCQFLIEQGETYDVTVEGCRSKTGEGHLPCEYYTDRLFPAVYEPLISDYRACEDEVLSLESSYCQYLMNVALAYGLGFDVCRWEFDNASADSPPKIECGQLLDQYFSHGNYSVIFDYKACQDGVLADTMPYCQYLLTVGANYSVTFEGCRTQLDLSDDDGPEPLNACYTYLHRLYEVEDENILFDIAACQDEILVKEKPYCQFILSLDGEG